MSQTEMKTGTQESGSQQLMKFLVELGPLVVFFIVNSRAGIFWGTGCFIAATAASLIASRFLFGRVPVMPLVSGVVVLVFGGLTLWLQDELFIKLKPTIVNSIFAAVLFGGLFFKKSLLSYLFGDVFSLDDEGWRKLTFRWACFFVFLAILNEFAWRLLTTDQWVTFKVFGIMPITMAFAISQVGLLQRHALNKDAAGE
ncbi:septation protein A [Hyphomicrobium sp. DMF-1]|jgi:intracellular septation protein|uniref:septation protein A n=1 Tax=Hyphomicrobium sp. DMF-1 TaxID=3019544 RepID=UPI0022EC1016|nr:septation protein A [Hyphomicrobium sp. DMF-1]WBT38642.1 septation protein A [Hyphomicrobium sp. DMF-1]